jgi:Na+/alanine symporter
MNKQKVETSNAPGAVGLYSQAIKNIVLHPVMLVFLGCAAVWFTILLKGMQFTRTGDMLKYLFKKCGNEYDTGHSSVQAFATTVGRCMGTGNITGTAS